MSTLAILFRFSFILVLRTVTADNELSVMRALANAYLDWTPRGIVDIGANVGGWTTAAQKVYPGVKTFMVDATPEREVYLKETKDKFQGIVDYEIAVLSGSDGEEVDFFVLDSYSGTGNSMFREKSEHYVGIEPTKRVTAKLDTLLKKHDVEYVDYLKLDVQGAELTVLAGATETLKKATFVQLEVGVVQYNEGGACWHEVDAFLREHGFYFYDSGDYIYQEDAFHSKGMGSLDVLYLKSSSAYMPTWLIDNKIELCGSKRQKDNIGDDMARSMHLTKSQSAGTNYNMNTNILSLLSAFLCGYIIGRVKHFGKVPGGMRKQG